MRIIRGVLPWLVGLAALISLSVSAGLIVALIVYLLSLLVL